jgi:NAD(P)H-dependent FMN reductase
MSKIAVIVGSTRPGRLGDSVAEWVAMVAVQERPADRFEIVDLADFSLPLLDEPRPAILGQYGKQHTVRWAETIADYDGFVFVTPEYNHSIPGVLKNALDFLHSEWNNKAAGIVSYGSHGGVRAAENLRLILAELRVATVRTQVALSLFTDFTASADTGVRSLTPGAHQRKALTDLLDDVHVWSQALRPVREGAPA